MVEVVILGMLVAAVIGYGIGTIWSVKPAPAPAPTIVQPKIFGLREFERLVAEIPPTADELTKKLVVSASTSLIVGFLGFEDRVVTETEEAMGKKAADIRRNGETVAGFQQAIIDIQASVARIDRESMDDQAWIDKLTELKKFKTS